MSSKVTKECLKAADDFVKAVDAFRQYANDNNLYCNIGKLVAVAFADSLTKDNNKVNLDEVIKNYKTWRLLDKITVAVRPPRRT